MVALMLYKAWGETRYEMNDSPTNYGYTGQREEAGIGLYYYNARWYDPELGRFTQADTIVPGAGNPRAYDRYAYVLNNPINGIDPSGRCTKASYGKGIVSDDECEGVDVYNFNVNNQIYTEYGWEVTGGFTSTEVIEIYNTGLDIQTYAENVTGGKGLDWMRTYLGGTVITNRNENEPWLIHQFIQQTTSVSLPGEWFQLGKNTVYLADGWNRQALAHELAHSWDYNTGQVMDVVGAIRGTADYLNDFIGGNIISTEGCRWCNLNDPNKPSSHIPPSYYWRRDTYYGNGSTADYFAEVFSWSIYDPSRIPGTDVKLWINTMIALEASALP
jgi:RHS repeat-associated protein